MSDTAASEFIWGARAIGEFIGKKPRPTFYLLQSGKLPARKEGDCWVASREALRRHMATPNNGYAPMAA